MRPPTELVAALAGSTLSDLLPDRSQARASDARPDAVIDVLMLEQGFVGLVAFGERVVVVPGRWTGTVTRDPAVAGALTAGRFGGFQVELFGEPLPHRGRSISVDQTNDSVVLNDEVVAKWQVDATVSPAPARLRSLRGTDLTPEPRAILEYTTAEGKVLTLLTAADYVTGATDGWSWAVELVRQHGSGSEALAPFAELGRMTARMHAAWAGLGVSVWKAQQVRGYVAQAHDDLAAALGLIDGEEGDRLRHRRAAVEQFLGALDGIDSTPVIPIHGDYHVGQVLQDPAGRLFIIDFDGSPVLAPEDRMQAWPAAVDVAGMMASIDHVARVVNRRTPGIDPTVALAWIPQAQRAFLHSYEEQLAALDLRSIFDKRLLPALLVHQELREYTYAGRHLPHWRYVPDQALGALLGEED